MKVLLISHTAMSRTAGQPKLHALSAYPDIELTALVPDKMNFYGIWERAEVPDDPRFTFVIGKARWQSIAGQWYLQHYTNALKSLRTLQPDIVNIWHEPWSLVCAQAISLTRRLSPKAKIIVETEQNIYKRLPPPFQQLQNYSLKHTDHVVGRNREAIKVIRQKGYHGPASIVPNGVDCELFLPQPEAERRECRKSFHLPAELFLIGYVGRLVAEKGLMDLISALALLPEACHLLLIGDGPLRSDLETEAERLKLSAHVHFIGNLPYLQLPHWMNIMDLLVLPSRTTPRWKEQFGRVLIEAGACGIPVVGSSSGAIPEVISDAGLIFPEGEVTALTDAIRKLHDDATLRKQLGAQGRHRAESLFSWQAVAANMHDIYCQLTT